MLKIAMGRVARLEASPAPANVRLPRIAEASIWILPPSGLESSPGRISFPFPFPSRIWRRTRSFLFLLWSGAFALCLVLAVLLSSSTGAPLEFLI